MSSIPENLRCCVTCQQEKPTSEYYFADKQTGRLASECKPCKIARTTNYKKQQELSQPGTQAAAMKAYREKHKDRLPEMAHRWNIAYNRKYPEHRRQLARDWRKRNPDQVKAQKYKRRERLKQNGGHFTGAQWLACKQQWHFTCLCCGRKEPAIRLEPDHVVSVKRGGANTIGNIQPLCRQCNSAKRTRCIDYRSQPAQRTLMI